MDRFDCGGLGMVDFLAPPLGCSLGTAEARSLGTAEARSLGDAEARSLGAAEARSLGDDIVAMAKTDVQRPS